MIEVKNLNKFYKNKQVLFDFSTTIDLDESCIYGLYQCHQTVGAYLHPYG